MFIAKHMICANLFFVRAVTPTLQNQKTGACWAVVSSGVILQFCWLVAESAQGGSGCFAKIHMRCADGLLGGCRFYTQSLPFLGNSPRALAAGPQAVVRITMVMIMLQLLHSMKLQHTMTLHFEYKTP